MYTYIYINYLLSGMHIQVLALLPKVPLDPYREVVAFGDVWPNIQIYRCANDPIRQTSTCWPCFQTRIYSNWWFQPPWKILVRLDHHPNYWGKYKMFQTTNQYIICLLLLLFPHRTIICCEVHVSFAFHQLLLLDDGGNMKPWNHGR